MQFKDLKKHIKDGKLNRAYTVFGDDAYVVKNATRLFCEHAIVDMPEFNITIFEKDTSAQTIIEACESLPMFSPLRLVVVRDYNDDIDKMLAYLNNPCPSTVLVFVKENAKDQFLKIFQLTEPVDCSKLDEKSLLQYIALSLKTHNTTILNDAAKLLLDYCNMDLSRISTELEKLCHYKMDGVIECEDIRHIVSPDTDYKIFELSEAVSQKNNKRAAQILKSLLDEKTPPVSLLGLLYSHFRRLLFCLVNKNDPNLSILLGVKEYAVKMSLKQASSYSQIALKKICDAFHEADYSFKTGKITDILALELLIMQILGSVT